MWFNWETPRPSAHVNYFNMRSQQRNTCTRVAQRTLHAYQAPPPCPTSPEPSKAGPCHVCPMGPPASRGSPGSSESPPTHHPRLEAAPAEKELHTESSRTQCVTGPFQTVPLDQALSTGVHGLSHGGSCTTSREGTRMRRSATQHGHKGQFRNSEVPPGRRLPPCNVTIGSLSSWEERHILTVFMIH